MRDENLENTNGKARPDRYTVAAGGSPALWGQSSGLQLAAL
jgi:hypothetical protein